MIRRLTASLGKRGGKTENAGQLAEDFAARHLKSGGARVLATNYRCRWGEIDIIARHGETLLFVEVRMRNHQRYATGAESVDFAKQRRLVATASHYLQETCGSSQPPCRFDVVSLSAGRQSGHYDVEWIQDAFRPEI